MKIHRYLDFGLEGGRISFLVASAVLACLLVPVSAAQSADDERFSLSLGVFVTDRESKTQLDGQTPGSGTDVDLENNLGFDRSDSVFRVDGYYRFNDKHRIDFSAFDLSRNASKQIQEELIWNGEVYPIDVQVDANLDFNIYKVAYTYSFVRREKGYLGASAGLYVADVGTSIAADSIGRSSNNSLTAPLPVIGLRGQYDLSERWSLRGSAEFFAVEYDAYSGSLYDVYAGIDYQVVEHVAIGIGINSVKLDLGVSKNNFNGDLDWRYDGGLVFFKFDF